MIGHGAHRLIRRPQRVWFKKLEHDMLKFVANKEEQPC
jgi:hypothetical protein